MKTWVKTSALGLIVAIVICLAARAQLNNLIQGTLTPAQDSIVQITAEAMGLEAVALEDLPRGGTFWWVYPSGVTAPVPFPPKDQVVPIYAIADGQFLVDLTEGQVAERALRWNLTQSRSSSMTVSAVDRLGNAVADLIEQIQETQFERTMMMSLGVPSPGEGGGGTNGGDYGNYSTYTIDTNLLWLEITNISNGWSHLSLHSGTNQFTTNQVFAILTKTNLLDATWNIETIAWPSQDQTSVMPFAAQNFNRDILFFRAQDWTGVDSDSDGISDWWAWNYFGTPNVTDTNLDYSGNNYSFAYEYSNHITPTVFKYTSLDVPNNFVSSSQPTVQLNVAGTPYYIATLIDDNNFSNAVWNAYSGSTVTVNLGSVQGWHEVWIGLRGHADDPSVAVWQRKRLKLDWTQPALFITNPTNTTVDIPMIQLQGFSPEALSHISYDLSNAAVTVTNQPVLVLNQDYDTNTFEFTTNTFQAFDVVLTNGVNTFTLHATDLAGNTTTANYSVTVDYSAKTNPPDVQLIWPLNGMKISASSIVCRGAVNDPTVTVTVQLVDANEQTNTVGSQVGRDGLFYADTLTLAAGTNHLSFTVTDAAGNIATTNIVVTTSDFGLTIDPVVPGQTVVTGSIEDDSHPIYVNGVQATNNGGGTWTALIPPIGVTGGAVVVNAGSDGDQSLQQEVPPPQGFYMDSSRYKLSENYRENEYDKDEFSWSENSGGFAMGQFFNGSVTVDTGITWPASPWPQGQPLGILWVTNNGQYEYHTMRTPSMFFQYKHANVAMTDPGTGSSFTWTADGALKYVTGGSLGSKDQRLYQFSGSVTVHHNPTPDLDEVPWSSLPDDETVADERVSLGGLGNLDANGKVYAVLADNARVVVTPKFTGADDYSFSRPTVQVYQIIHQTEHPALTDTNRARTNLGVGEEVNLSGMPVDTKWEVSAGGLSVTNGSSTKFTAPSNEATAKVTAIVGGKSLPVTFTVKKPSGVDHAMLASIVHFNTNVAAAKMQLWPVVIAPTSVSFYRVQCLEVGKDASNVTGYFILSPAPSHKGNGADQWFQLDENNTWPSNWDWAGIWDLPPPWSSGGFTWDIPANWKIGNGPTNSMNGWNQLFSIDASGTVTVQKFNHSVTRTINDVITTQ